MKSCRICASSPTVLFCSLPDSLNPQRTWEIWKCGHCGHGSTEPQPTPEELPTYYPPLYVGDVQATFDEYASGQLQRSRSWKREVEKVDLVERFCSGGRLLDVGAADGKFLLALDGRRWQRTGLEPLGEVAEAVNQRFPEIHLTAGQLDSPELDGQQFDVITLWHVLEHLPDPRQSLWRLRTLLAPGGRLVLSVPNFDSYQARWFGPRWYSLDVPRHLHHFSPRSLELLLAEANLSLVKHLFFSRVYNIHQLKHSALTWSRERFSSSIPYYLAKPLLMVLPFAEARTSRYGVVTTIARA